MAAYPRKHPQLAQLGAVIATVVVALMSAAQAQTLEGAGLVEALRRGGYVIYFRHAPTDWSQQDRVRDAADVASCDPQRMRQLSERGRELAARVGAVIRRLAIPVGRVLASEYCRTVETARLLGLGPVETTRDVINTRVAEYVGGREALARTARARLAAPPAPGANTVIVAHGNVFLLAAGTRPAEAGAAIVRGDGRGGFDVVTLLRPEAWSDLLAAQGGERAEP